MSKLPPGYIPLTIHQVAPELLNPEYTPGATFSGGGRRGGEGRGAEGGRHGGMRRNGGGERRARGGYKRRFEGGINGSHGGGRPRPSDQENRYEGRHSGGRHADDGETEDNGSRDNGSRGNGSRGSNRPRLKFAEDKVDATSNGDSE